MATYYVTLDIHRDGFATLYHIGDISARLIGQASWNNGMDSPDQTFANPARLNMMLDNIDGAWNPETLGAELLTNGDFATWSSDNPSSWTITGESAGDPEVTQRDSNQLHADTMTTGGSCNFYSTGSPITISQLSFPIRTSYQVTIEISASKENAGYLACYYDSVRISPYYHIAGTYTFYFNTDNVASGAFKITATGNVDMTVNSVSVKQTSLYGKLIEEGILCRFKIISPDPFAYTQFYGRLSSMSFVPGSNGRRVVSMTCTDLMYDLLDTEYIPPLYTDVTADVPMAAVFDEPIIPFPYSDQFWLLGIQGSSELGLTTTLYTPPDYTFDTGISTFAWVGDNSIDATNEGTSAQSFLRDVVEGEVYGRFFFDMQTNPQFVFHNRHRDAKNKTVSYTIADGDYEPDLSVFSKTPILNNSSVSYQPRVSGTAGTVIWSRDSLDMGTGKTDGVRKWTVRYRDVNNESARIGASSVLPMLPGVDLIATNLNTGEDVSSTLVGVVVPGANSAEVTIINTNPFPLRFSLIQLRGTPLTTFDPLTVTSVNGDSERAYKHASERINYRLVDNEIDAKAIADYRVYKNGEPVPVFEKIGFIKDKTSLRFYRGLLNPIGDRITIIDSFLNHSADYFIVGYRHTVTFGEEGTHTVIYTLKPAAKENFWILGTSLLGTDTRLGL